MTLVSVSSRAGTSPNCWTRGLASPGLAGTRGLASLVPLESRGPELSNKPYIVKIDPVEP